MDERTEELKKWRAQQQRLLEEAQDDLMNAQKRVDAARERLALLDRLLVLEGDEEPGPEFPMGEGPENFMDACERVLREAGRPMHISELLEGLRDGGVALPGRGTDANVIVRLRRSDGRFVRTGRGTYGLPEFGIPEAPTTNRRRRARRKTA
jgi:hypothetical protein